MRAIICSLFFAFALALYGEDQTAAEQFAIHAKMHAMAFGAVLAAFNGDPVSTLTKDADEIRRRKTLEKWWDVHSRDELLALLNGIESGENGHRSAFWAMGEKLKHLKPGTLWPTILSSAKAGEDIEGLVLVVSYMHAPKNKSLPLTAWDFGRYVNLCRWGWDAGYLSESEMWERILPVARLLQKSYSSWEDYAADYMCGREFYSAPAMRENGAKMEKIVQLLLNELPNGAWGSIPWEEPLGEGPITIDRFAAKIKARAIESDISPGPSISGL